MKRIILLITFLIGIGVAITFAVKQSTTPTTNKLSVATSFYPLYDFAQAVGGDKVQVTNMTPAGAEPHDFEPGARQLAQAQKSAVFIYNGSSFEPWTTKFVKDYDGVSIKSNSGISLHAVSADDHEAEAHDHDQTDPHFWLDPVLAQQMVRTIRDGLSKAQPNDAAYFSGRAQAYIEKLQQLDADYQSRLEHCQQDTVVVSHSALGYLAARYHFNAQAIAGLSPDSEPSAAKIAEIANLVRQKNIHYILFETLVSPRIADTIAQETGAQTAVFNPLEGLTHDEQKQGLNYLSVQRDNLATLRTALACQ
jgi:zinc transport system substrate-binding protein